MLLIESTCHGDVEATEVLELSFEYRTKSRLRARLRSGEEVGLFLARGTVLRGGDRLIGSDGRVVRVESAPEALLEARCSTALDLARVAYHLGNRHVAVEVGADAQSPWLRLQADHVLEGMLRGLGATVSSLSAAFEPESGAYAHGHQHPGESPAGARIHMMGA